MKRKVFLLLLAVVLCLSGCADSNYVLELNNSFNGEFSLAAEPPADGMEGFERAGGFGCYMLISLDGTENERLTEYTISGYPDCLDDYKVTSIKTKDAKYKLFGFSVGSPMPEGQNALAANGYKIQSTETSGWGYAYKKGKINIRLFGSDTIGMIWIQLDITNRTGVVF